MIHAESNILDFRSNRMSRKARKKTFHSAAPKAIAEPVVAVRRPTPDTWGIDPDAVDLPANADVETVRDHGGKLARARRYDVFSLLFYRPGSKLLPTSYDAVRRLQSDLAILHRTQGAGDAIRATGKGATGALSAVMDGFTRAQREAGERITAVLVGMTPWCAKLIRELAEHGVVQPSEPNWHAIVKRQTGEIDRYQRGGKVRFACDDLAESYRRIDNEPKRASA